MAVTSDTGKKAIAASSPSGGWKTSANAPAKSSDVPWSAEDSRMLDLKGFRNFKKIGYGQYATVHQADRYDARNGSTNQVAMKFIDLSTKSKNYRTKLFPREIEATRHLRHRNIVPVRKVIMSKDKERVWIVMELEKSDLLQVLDHEKRVDEKKGRIWVQQLMSGLKYMHDAQWAHRDLKVENVLIGFDERALLSDFGFSRQQNVHCLSSTHLGSMQYSAPEVLDTRAKVVGPEGTAAADYDAFKADVWALGVIMFVMFIGFLPVNATTEERIREQQNKIHKLFNILPPDLTMSPLLTDLMKKMLTIDPAKRISLIEALRHPWVTSDQPVSPSSSSGPKKSSPTALSPLALEIRSGIGLSSKKKAGIRVPGYERSVISAQATVKPVSSPGLMTLPMSQNFRSEDPTAGPVLKTGPSDGRLVSRSRSRCRRSVRRLLILSFCLLTVVVVMIFAIFALILSLPNQRP